MAVLTLTGVACAAKAATIASAVRRPMPGTSAISPTEAARIFRNDPNRLRSALRRTSPSPETVSYTHLTLPTN